MRWKCCAGRVLLLSAGFVPAVCVELCAKELLVRSCLRMLHNELVVIELLRLKSGHINVRRGFTLPPARREVNSDSSGV